MDSLHEFLNKKLNARKEKNAFRELKIANKTKIDFFSNDYLGLAQSNLFQKTDLPTGSTGSRLLGGNSELHESTEKFLAQFYQSEAALIFNSGYAANTGLFSCLLEKGDTFIFDELCHASIREGIRLNNATSWSFFHNDLSDLEKKLKIANGKKIVIAESVYSMDGDFAPSKEMASLCKKYDANLIVDEAHAVGIFGKNGEGRVVEENLHNDVFARIVTFGKAFGVHGAAVLGNKILRNYLINFSRPFIYTTALPPQSVQHIKETHELVQKNPKWKEKMHSLIRFYREELDKYSELKKNSTDSFSAIQTIIIPGNEKVKSVSKKLMENGFDVRPILSPTVAEGNERLRICLHVFNTEEEIKKLLNNISF